MSHSNSETELVWSWLIAEPSTLDHYISEYVRLLGTVGRYDALTALEARLSSDFMALCDQLAQEQAADPEYLARLMRMALSRVEWRELAESVARAGGLAAWARAHE